MNPSSKRICPYCSGVNTPDAAKCLHCNRSLTIACPRCNTVNWVGDATCASCGARLDVLSRIAAREEIRTSDRFTRTAQTAGEMKATDEAASRKHMEHLWAEDTKRRAEDAELLAQQKAQERKTAMAALIAVFIVIVVVAMIVVVLSIQ